MTIRTLIETLQAIPANQLGDAGAKLAEEHVIYPIGWEDCETQFHHAVWRKSKKEYNLRFSAFPKMGLSEMSPLLVSSLERTRRMQFKPGTFEVGAEVCWPKEVFAQERSLGSLSQIKVRGSFYALDPTRVRIGFFSGKVHELEVELKGMQMKISATGDYSRLLPRIISELKPQSATIRLSPSDAERWLKKATGFQKWVLSRALQPRKQNYLTLRIGGGVSFEEKETIETTIPAAALASCADAIGRPLINEVTGEQTFLVSLSKVFLWRGQILPALQKIVRIIGDLKPMTLFGYPLLTTSQAKELLEKEIELVSKSYELMFFLGDNTHMKRGPLVKRLAQEHFGDDILMPFGKMSESEYLAFLQARGFSYGGELDNHCEAPYVLKEMYLLQFLRQSYAKDPRDSIERFRMHYVNSEPAMEITGKAKQDAARIDKLSLPTQALLSGFVLEECSGDGENEINIRKQGDKFHFWIRVSLDSCLLLDFQEEICERVGMVCY